MVDRNTMNLSPEVRRGLRERKTFVGTDVVLSGKLELGHSVEIWHHAIVGFAPDKIAKTCELVRHGNGDGEVTSLGSHTIIHPYVLVERGATIGDGVEVMEFSRIGSGTTIGDGSLIEYGAKIYENVSIGRGAIVGGFSCNDSRIGSSTTMMGTLVHRYPTNLTVKEWNESKERPPAPVIGDNVLIGFNALIIGDVEVGDGAKVGAGAIVTEDIPRGKKVIMDISYKN